MRRKSGRMKSPEKEATEAALTAALKRLNNDADDFIYKLLTESERLTVGRRVLIAHLILSGYTRMEINQLLSVSPNTYTKIKRWLDSELPDFESTHKTAQARSSADGNPHKRHSAAFTLENLRKNYPMHFLLFTLSSKLLNRLKN
jgi:Trp operon repressor